MTKPSPAPRRAAQEPLVRLVKKPELAPLSASLLRVAAFLLAIVAGALFLLLLGHNPLAVYAEMIRGCFRSKMAIQSTVTIGIPLLITSLGVTLAFKMKFWNIGAEGQLIMGAVFASYFALFHSDWPHIPLMLACFLAGLIGGGLWGLIPALFKARFHTNETLLTLMLNYIALYIVDYLRQGPWQDPEARGFPKIATFDPNAYLGKAFGVQSGWIIGLVLVVLVFVYLRFTKSGYEISVVGESQATARYAGINVKRVTIVTMVLSGAISGLAGMLQITGTDFTLSTGVASGVGFTAIIVAWLARLNPFVILLFTSFFSILEKGSGVIQTAFGLSSYASDILQGVILFFILGCEFFVRYSFAFRKKGGKAK